MTILNILVPQVTFFRKKKVVVNELRSSNAVDILSIVFSIILVTLILYAFAVVS